MNASTYVQIDDLYHMWLHSLAMTMTCKVVMTCTAELCASCKFEAK